jgi:hypothetical protein
LDTSPLDLVDGLNASAAYYRFVEADMYDNGLTVMRDKRDFRLAFLARIDVLLSYEHDNYARSLIRYEIERQTSALANVDRRPSEANILERARASDREGVRLLKLSDPLTVETLRHAYRVAAKTHHPDVGGDTEAMRKINDAYTVFMALLEQDAAARSTLGELRVASVEDVFRNARIQRFTAYLDDLAADRALETYVELGPMVFDQVYRGVELVAKLCELLAAANRPEDAGTVLSDLEKLVERARARGLTYTGHFERCRAGCNAPATIRFVPNHLRQADNLLRLGVIDEKRYAAIKSRVLRNEEQVDQARDEFQEAVRGDSFLLLPLDPKAMSVPEGLIPPPAYYSRIETLLEPQRSEYACAFHGGRTDLIGKYLAVRFDTLMRSAFLGYSDLDALVAETQSLVGTAGIKPSLRSVGEVVLRMIRFLQTRSRSDRAWRVEKLLKLDGDGNRAVTLTVSLTGESLLFMPRPIVPTPSYVDFATGPMERIDRFSATGREKSPEEEAEDRIRYADRRAFYESDVFKRARDAVYAREKCPDLIVATVSTLLETIYDRLATEPEQSLDVGDWTDKLTANLMKTKRFAEVPIWLDRYEALPAELKARTKDGVAETIRKRRIRAASLLAK